MHRLNSVEDGTQRGLKARCLHGVGTPTHDSSSTLSHAYQGHEGEGDAGDCREPLVDLWGGRQAWSLAPGSLLECKMAPRNAQDSGMQRRGSNPRYTVTMHARTGVVVCMHVAVLHHPPGTRI